MRLLIILIVLFLFYSCNTQKFSGLTRKQEKEYVQETKAFIKYIRATEHEDEPLLLVDETNMEKINKCIDRLFRDTALFTKNEQELIISNIRNPLLKSWDDPKFSENLRTISKDTVTAIFRDRKKWWTYFYAHYGNGYKTYSSPIFLRDYTLCLFYSDQSCGGLCGSGQVILFKKEGYSWTPFKSFCEWIS